jgi:hypothetical protein
MAVRLIPSRAAPETAPVADRFIDLVAASQTSNLATGSGPGARILHAALAPTGSPMVKLPDLKACLACPNFQKRDGTATAQTDPETFADWIASCDPAAAYFPDAPQAILLGLDWTDGPHVPAIPGFDVLARVIDPRTLAEGLSVNRILPDCPCAVALHAAADDDGWRGLALDDLRQEAFLKSQSNDGQAVVPPRPTKPGPDTPSSGPSSIEALRRSWEAKLRQRPPTKQPDPKLRRKLAGQKTPSAAPGADLIRDLGRDR